MLYTGCLNSGIGKRLPRFIEKCLRFNKQDKTDKIKREQKTKIRIIKA